MSDPTGDALNAAGLTDDGGVSRPTDSGREQATMEQQELRDLAALMLQAPMPMRQDLGG